MGGYRYSDSCGRACCAAISGEDTGWAGRLRKGRRLFVTVSGAELSPGAHSVDEWTGQSESTSGQEADRRQDAAFCPSLLDPVRHPAPFREVAHDSLILSCHLQPLWSLVHRSRTAWAYLPPVPEGTAHESRTAESRVQTNVEARSSRAVEPVRVPVQLVESRWQDMLDQGILATCPRMHLTASRLPCGERSECFGLSRCQFVPQNMNRPLRRTFF